MLISFSIGKYKDEVLCDVAPMHVGHILLGRPWLFDRKVTHDGFKNRHSFLKDNKIVTLVLLTPRYEDQMKLKKENELKKNCETESSKKDDEKKESERKKESEEYERKTEKTSEFLC